MEIGAISILRWQLRNWTREAGSQSSDVFIRFPLTDCKVAENAFQLVAFHHSNDLGVTFVEESPIYSTEWKYTGLYSSIPRLPIR